MNKDKANDQKRLPSAGIVIRKVGTFTMGLIMALLAILRDVFVSSEVEQNEDRRLHDSDLSGELNHRTGRLDAGADPYGWYDD